MKEDSNFGSCNWFHKAQVFTWQIMYTEYIMPFEVLWRFCENYSEVNISSKVIIGEWLSVIRQVGLWFIIQSE